MKKIIVIIISICFISNTYGQSFASGFGAGLLMTNGTYLDSFDVKKPTTMRPGFKAYWMGRVNLEGNMNISPEIGYTFKGFRVKNPLPGVAEQEIILHYLDFKFIQEYTIKEKYFVKIGPGISVAVAARDKQISTTGLRSNTPLAFNFAAWGRYEGNVSFALGAHLGAGFLVELTATKGISNIYDGDDGPNVKNVVYGIGFGKYLR